MFVSYLRLNTLALNTQVYRICVKCCLVRSCANISNDPIGVEDHLKKLRFTMLFLTLLRVCFACRSYNRMNSLSSSNKSNL